MDFEYVTGWYSKKTGQVKPLGGFPSLKAAKEFSETVDTLFWGNGFFFIDSPEGIHIKGEEKFWGNKRKWYSPEEVKSDEVKLWQIKKNGDEEIVRFDSYLPYDDYKKFTQGNVFKESVLQNDRKYEMAGIKNAGKGNIFILTEKGYAETLEKVKPEREVGKPVRVFEDSVPASWVEKGYVKEISASGREKEADNKHSVLKKLEQNKVATLSNKDDLQKEHVEKQHDYVER